MVAILGANSVSGEYHPSNSLRINRGDTAFLDQTFSSAGNRRTFTISFWVKRGNLGATDEMHIYSADADNFIRFESSDKLRFACNTQGVNPVLETNRVFRDPAAWYHIFFAVDTTQSTASNRFKLYVNGVEETSFATDSRSSISQNTDLDFNNSSQHCVGTRSQSTSDSPYDGYITEFHSIDGTAKAHTDFGEFNDNGVWIPKKYSGTYGTNGFYLEFKQTGTSQNSSGIGADTSGNDNHFAVTNLASTDITEDTCTNNFATLSPIDAHTTSPTLAEGNLGVDFDSGVSTVYNISTIGVSSGKFYCEIKAVTIPDFAIIGIASRPCKASGNSDNLTVNQYNYGYHSNDGNVKSNSSSGVSYGATYDDGDIIGIALDLDNNKLYFSKNGTFQNSGDPTSGSTGTGAISIEAPSGTIDGFYYFAVGDNRNDHATRMDCNFGNPAFSISSGNNDGKYGNFEYAVPSGYYALCTKRLAEFG
jgi:hypothetical protein